MKPQNQFCIYLITLGMLGCSSTPKSPGTSEPPPPVEAPRLDFLMNELNREIANPLSDTSAIDVHYITNRELLGAEPNCSDQAFGVNPGKDVKYGVCRINVPKKHSVGSIESTTNSRADTHTYFRSLDHKVSDLNETLSQIKGQKSVLLFIHGFNVKFEQALFRTAQIAYDLKYQGPVFVFTWPAGPADGLLGSTLINRTYEQNSKSAAASIAPLITFFKELNQTGTPIHLLVHSMGHQIVIPALKQAAEDPSFGALWVRELILNAPDFPASQFKESAPLLKKMAKRVTVYCSTNDKAMGASETYNKEARIGACALTDGIDIINVGEVSNPGISGLGHGYYASRPILTDVAQLLLGIEADKRLFIRKSEPNSTENFYLRP